MEKKNDNLPSCNSCTHNGTWNCIKCSGFDRYEEGKVAVHKGKKGEGE